MVTRPPRKTPRAYELTPVILDRLKHDKQLGNDEIDAAVQPLLKRRGYRNRAQAITHARTYLKYEGYINNQDRGVWTITESGMAADLAEEWGKLITAKYEKRKNRRTKPRK